MPEGKNYHKRLCQDHNLVQWLLKPYTENVSARMSVQQLPVQPWTGTPLDIDPCIKDNWFKTTYVILLILLLKTPPCLSLLEYTQNLLWHT
jgi:hypothetical protein